MKFPYKIKLTELVELPKYGIVFIHYISFLFITLAIES